MGRRRFALLPGTMASSLSDSRFFPDILGTFTLFGIFTALTGSQSGWRRKS